MTLADSTTSSRKSWLGVLRRGNAARGAAGLHKPVGDMADLLIMSNIDLKAPPPSPGSADLLDALVQEHLEHVTDKSPLPPIVAFPPLLPAGAEGEMANSDESQVELLQREIEMLLQGATGTADVEELVAMTETAAAPVVSSEATAEAPPETPASETISSAELDMLLAQGAPLAAAGAASSAVTSEAMPTEESAEQKLSEAEGVLADELTRLLAESPEAAVETASTAPETPTVAPPTVVATPDAGAGASPGSAVPGLETGTAPVAEIPAEVPGGTVTPDAAQMAAEITSSATSAETVEASTEMAADFAAPEAAGSRGVGRLKHLAGDVALMMAQLVDLPFGWIDELNKNILGVAAFLLMMGGVFMWVLARFMQ